MTSSAWMVYGANGYTGNLIAREAAKRGLKPILAGRGEAVESLAAELGLEARRFALGGDPDETALHLEGVSAVLHCAGPFSSTSRAMLDACLASAAKGRPVHYLDITGEIAVFEAVHARDAELKAAGVAALPGAGFDVVPTDCVAAMLKRALPSSTRLALAFRSDGRFSPGTAKSAVEGLALGGRVRRAGRIERVPVAHKRRRIPFSRGECDAILSPWGDVSTAFHSTGIPDIEFYIASPRSAALPMKALAVAMRVPGVLGFVQRRIERSVRGPTAEELENGRCWVWGEATDGQGRSATVRLEVPEPYRFTVDSAIECALRYARGEAKPGAWTPSKAFGPDFVLGFQGVALK